MTRDVAPAGAAWAAVKAQITMIEVKSNENSCLFSCFRSLLRNQGLRAVEEWSEENNRGAAALLLP